METYEEGYKREAANRVERRSDDIRRSRRIERERNRHVYRSLASGNGKGDFDRSVDNKEIYDRQFDEWFGPYCRDCRRCHKGGCR